MRLTDFKLLKGSDFVVNLNLRTVEVREGNRRVRATWTPEMAQDMEMYHNVDIEEEMTRLLSEQIAQEIDREIVNNLLPMVRRIGARTLGQDLVPVQPLDGPVGQIQYGDYSFKTFKLLRG